MTICGLTGDALIEHLQQGLADSLWKRVQERFGSIEDFTFPRVTDGAKDVTFLTRRELDEQGILPCILDGERVPLEFAFDLDMLPAPAKRARREPYREMRKSAEFMDTLKSRIGAWCPIKEHSRRMYVQGAPHVGHDSPHPNGRPMSQHLIGSMILIREDNRPAEGRDKNDSSPTGRNLAFAFYPTAYAAHRKCIHQTNSYGSEKSGVLGLRDSWSLLVGRLDREWRKGAPEEVKTVLKGELIHLTARTRKALENATSDLKVEAEAFFTKISEKFEKADKNIGAQMAQMTAGGTRLGRRIDEIDRKGRYNFDDSASLGTEIQSHENRFAAFVEAIEGTQRRQGAATILRREIDSPRGYFKRSFSSDQERENEAKILVSRLGLPIHAVEGMRLRPFVAFARLMALEHTSLEAAIERRNPAEAKKAMVALVTLSKLQFANRTFEELREMIAQGASVPIHKLADASRHLQRVLTARNVFPDASATDYETAYQQVEEHGKDLAARLAKCERIALTETKRADLNKRMRTFLDKVDVEKEVLTLLYGPKA